MSLRELPTSWAGVHAIPLRHFFFLCVWSVLAAVATAQVGIGDKREDILARYGRPTSIAKRGDHEIFLYPKGARIEFVNGLVADVKGPLPEPVAVAPVAAKETAPQPPPAEVAPPVATTPPVAAPAPKAVTNPPAKTPPPPTGAEALAKHLEDAEATPDESEREEHVDSPFESVPAFLLGLLLRFGFTIAALKLAFKYWEMDAFWNGILKIAGIDLGIHALCELLGPLSGGFTTMGAVENGIAGLVLIYTINRFCFNKRIQNAVATAAAVKLVVTLCYIFGALVLLNSAFG